MMVIASITEEMSSPVTSRQKADSGEGKTTTADFDLLHRRLEKEWESLQNQLGMAICPGDNGQVGSYSRSDDELA
jgi:hypothetical protein